MYPAITIFASALLITATISTTKANSLPLVPIKRCHRKVYQKACQKIVFCTGAIIHKTYIITSVDCTNKLELSRGGGTHLELFGQKRWEEIHHDHTCWDTYKAQPDLGQLYDVSLLELPAMFPLESARVLRLPPDNVPLPIGTRLQLINLIEDQQPELNSYDVVVKPIADCDDALTEAGYSPLGWHMLICVRAVDGKPLCQRGSDKCPLGFLFHGEDVVYGIAGNGEGVFLRVGSHLKWLKRTLEGREDSEVIGCDLEEHPSTSKSETLTPATESLLVATQPVAIAPASITLLPARLASSAFTTDILAFATNSSSSGKQRLRLGTEKLSTLSKTTVRAVESRKRHGGRTVTTSAGSRLCDVVGVFTLKLFVVSFGVWVLL